MADIRVVYPSNQKTINSGLLLIEKIDIQSNNVRRILSTIKVDHTVVGYRHIRDRLRESILSGRLAPTTKLPSTQDLAKLWHVDVGTVHTALTPLVKEGLLIRQLRKGTFVCERKRQERLTSVGIYYGENIWAPNYSFFLQALHQALLDQLEQLDIQVTVCRDPRPSWQHRTACPELVEMAKVRKIQAVISSTSGWGRYVWMNRLPVPSVHFTTAKIRNKVGGDTWQQAEIAVRGIAEQGCRSVGLICPNGPNRTTEDGPRPPEGNFLEACVDLIRQHGLQTRNQWIRVSSTEYLSQAGCERFGYEQFHELWRLPSHPEGLLVFDDTVVRGTITALLETQVRVPEQLKLVFHRNAEIPLICPLPAAFVVFSVAEAAQAAIEMIQKQFGGQPCAPVLLKHRLEHAEPSPTEMTP